MRPAPTRHELKEPAPAGATLVRKSARELARLMASRAVSPVEVLDAHLAVIEALNPKLNAIVTLVAEQARDAAARSDRIIAVSQFTAMQVVGLLGVEGARLRVVHHGVRPAAASGVTRQKIILHVGAIQSYMDYT